MYPVADISVHQYECIALNKAVSLQRGRQMKFVVNPTFQGSEHLSAFVSTIGRQMYDAVCDDR